MSTPLMLILGGFQKARRTILRVSMIVIMLVHMFDLVCLLRID
jgi:hypothetical protein